MTEEELLAALNAQKEENRQLNKEIQTLQAALQDTQAMYHQAREQASGDRARARHYKQKYREIERSHWWRITKPGRTFFGKIEKLASGSRLMSLPSRARRLIRRVGVFGAFRAVFKRIRFGRARNLYLIPRERRAQEEAAVFPRRVRFSLLVPLYNTPQTFLREMIRSVQDQTYPDWELCMADGSDEQHNDVEATVRALAQNDPRLVYKRLDHNGGISENTNACIELATGDYIGLFDHDDLLHPSALYKAMCAICEQDADFIYTDEAVFTDGDLTRLMTYHYKPDFAPDNLRSNNYICHFSVFARSILDRAGRFDSRYDGSQDHDIILRLTEQAQRVVHIPELLYFWRCHKASVASDIASKPYAVKAGRRAVHDHVVRVTGRECVVTSSPVYPTLYRIDYELIEEPPVSLLIYGNEKASVLIRCLVSVAEETEYPALDVTVVLDRKSCRLTDDQKEQLTKTGRVRIADHTSMARIEAVNAAARETDGKYLLLLESNTEAISPDWIRQMLMLAQRGDIGAVGAKMYDTDNTIRHAGILLGVGKDRVAAYENIHVPRDNAGYMGRLAYVRNTSAVSMACMMVSRRVFDELGGFCEDYTHAYADFDFCLRAREKGYLHAITPFAEMYWESEDATKAQRKARSNREKEDRNLFSARWADAIAKGDPYFNPGFSPDFTDFRLR